MIDIPLMCIGYKYTLPPTKQETLVQPRVVHDSSLYRDAWKSSQNRGRGSLMNETCRVGENHGELPFNTEAPSEQQILNKRDIKLRESELSCSWPKLVELFQQKRWKALAWELSILFPYLSGSPQPHAANGHLETQAQWPSLSWGHFRAKGRP